MPVSGDPGVEEPAALQGGFKAGALPLGEGRTEVDQLEEGRPRTPGAVRRAVRRQRRQQVSARATGV